MAYPDLKSLISAFRKRDLICDVHVEVDSDQEIAEIHRRVIAADGPALLFHRVKDASFPVVTNLFGTMERMNMAFGKDPIEFMQEFVTFAQHAMPPTLGKIWEAKKFLPRLLKVGTKHRRLGNPVQASRMLPLDLNRIPLLKTWPEDGGHFVTLPMVYTEHPEGLGHNLAMYRMQRHDENHMGIHWQIAKGGGYHYALAEENNQSLPLTLHLGGPPALILSAIAPLPENVGELMLASFLANQKIPMCHVGDHPLPVIGTSEFVFCGEVLPKVRRPEGPFGDHYGYYSLEHDYPVFQCNEVWHAKDAIYPATVVGKPRQEDYYIGEYLQELLKPLFPLVMPGIRDLWSYGETGFHSLASAVVQERYPREAMVTAFRILGEGQLSLTKFLLVTDQPQDLKDFRSLFRHVLERCNFHRDLYVFNHLSMDTLDYTGPEVNKGSKGILLGVGDPIRKLPEQVPSSLPSYVQDARMYCAGCLVVQTEPYSNDIDAAQRIAQEDSLSQFPIIMLVDDAKATTANDTRFLWTIFTRFEPAGDIFSSKQNLKRHHVSYDMPVVIDARMKPNYPKELFCDPKVADQVSKRWSEYFPKGMESGSSDLGHL